ncbi:MAG: glycosyltransferase involved in cell wall biosynthesis [Bacteroidia bacterium]|jgi:glycosyltransferase involved in cell wall biosynthesis
MSLPITILHISSPLSWRGGEQQLMYLHKGLLSLGYNSKVFCPNEGILASKLSIAERVLYSKRSGFDPFVAYKLAKFCRANKIDLIHAHDAHAHTTAVLAASVFRNKTPVILSRRVDFPIGGSWFSKYKYNHKRVKAILCVSNVIRDMVKPAIHASHIQVVTVHSGVDLSRFKSVTPIDIKAELSLPENAKLVANFSALAGHKDYFTFIDTAEVICGERSEVVFLIFGKGELEEELKIYVKSKNLVKQVLFVGFRNNLPEIYPNIDVLLFTSKTEGLGTTVLDAFASMVSVVATRAGGVPEMVIHEETGLLSPIGDSKSLANQVIQTLDDQNLSKRLTENALKKCESFSVDHLVRRTKNWYTNVLNN